MGGGACGTACGVSRWRASVWRVAVASERASARGRSWWPKWEAAASTRVAGAVEMLGDERMRGGAPGSSIFPEWFMSCVWKTRRIDRFPRACTNSRRLCTFDSAAASAPDAVRSASRGAGARARALCEREKPLSPADDLTPSVDGGSRLGWSCCLPMPRRSHCASSTEGSARTAFMNSAIPRTPEPSLSSMRKRDSRSTWERSMLSAPSAAQNSVISNCPELSWSWSWKHPKSARKWRCWKKLRSA